MSNHVSNTIERYFPVKRSLEDESAIDIEPPIKKQKIECVRLPPELWMVIWEFLFSGHALLSIRLVQASNLDLTQWKYAVSNFMFTFNRQVDLTPENLSIVKHLRYNAVRPLVALNGPRNNSLSLVCKEPRLMKASLFRDIESLRTDQFPFFANFTPNQWFNFSGLRRLESSSHELEVTDQLIECLPNLEVLIVGKYHNLTTVGLSLLKNCKHLNISMLLGDVDMPYLNQIPKLELIECIFINNCHLQLRDTKELNFTNSPGPFVELLNSLPNLTALTRHNAYIELRRADLSKLLKLDIRGCKYITDDDIRTLKVVEDLNIAGCVEVASQGIEKLVTLRVLDISNCTRIKETALLNMVHLKQLTAKGLSGISASGLLKMWRHRVKIITK
jgi:hypothetical protein